MGRSTAPFPIPLPRSKQTRADDHDYCTELIQELATVPEVVGLALRELMGGDPYPPSSNNSVTPQDIASWHNPHSPNLSHPGSDDGASCSAAASPEVRDGSRAQQGTPCGLTVSPSAVECLPFPTGVTMGEQLRHSLRVLSSRQPEVVSPIVVLGALRYMAVAQALNIGRIGESNWFRLFHTALLVSSKMHLDISRRMNTAFATVLNVAQRDMVGLEVEFLYLVDFNLHFSVEEYYEYADWVQSLGASISRDTEVRRWLSIIETHARACRKFLPLTPVRSTNRTPVTPSSVRPRASAAGTPLSMSPTRHQIATPADAVPFMDLGITGCLDTGTPTVSPAHKPRAHPDMSTGSFRAPAPLVYLESLARSTTPRLFTVRRAATPAGMSPFTEGRGADDRLLHAATDALPFDGSVSSTEDLMLPPPQLQPSPPEAPSQTQPAPARLPVINDSFSPGGDHRERRRQHNLRPPRLPVAIQEESQRRPPPRMAPATSATSGRGFFSKASFGEAPVAIETKSYQCLERISRLNQAVPGEEMPVVRQERQAMDRWRDTRLSPVPEDSGPSSSGSTPDDAPATVAAAGGTRLTEAALQDRGHACGSFVLHHISVPDMPTPPTLMPASLTQEDCSLRISASIPALGAAIDAHARRVSSPVEDMLSPLSPESPVRGELPVFGAVAMMREATDVPASSRYSFHSPLTSFTSIGADIPCPIRQFTDAPAL